MIAFGLLSAFLLIFAAGGGTTLLLFRERERLNVIECAALSWFFGCGVVSFSLWMGGFVFSGAGLQLSVTAVALALVFCGAISARRKRATLEIPSPRSWLESFLVLIVALEILLIFRSSFGHGLGWDGLLNWEIKARYAFFNDGVLPASYFRSETRAFTHPAYPLFLPMTELWFYLWMGEANQFWIKLIFPFFYAAGATLLAITASRLTSNRPASLAVAALLFFVPCLTNSPGDAGGGYADVPLSMLYLVTIAYLLLQLSARTPGTLGVFAISLALLPWIKHEGTILWSIGTLCGAAVLVWQRKPARAFLWLLPGLFVVASWNIFLHFRQPVDHREFVAPTLAALLANASRILPILHLTATEMLSVHRWSLFWPFLALAFIALFWRARDRRLLLLGAAVIAPVCIYAGTYLFSGWTDYTAHLQTSYPRLLLQVMPVGWLAIALVMARPAGAALPRDIAHQSRNR